MTPISLRPPESSEMVLIRDSWCRSFAERRCPKGWSQWLWFRAVRLIIDWVLRHGACLLVATLEDAPDEVLGWVCWEPPTEQHPLALHYVFVKPYARKQGIGAQLVRAALSGADDRGYRLTHHTPDGDGLRERTT